jgi:hypothetical protein
MSPTRFLSECAHNKINISYLISLASLQIYSSNPFGLSPLGFSHQKYNPCNPHEFFQTYHFENLNKIGPWWDRRSISTRSGPISNRRTLIDLGYFHQRDHPCHSRGFFRTTPFLKYLLQHLDPRRLVGINSQHQIYGRCFFMVLSKKIWIGVQGAFRKINSLPSNVLEET